MKHLRSDNTRTRNLPLSSVMAMVLAFLTGQHHLVHMLLIAMGVGGSGLGVMTMSPLLRRTMLILSLAMLGVALYQYALRSARQPPPLATRALVWVSCAATLGFLIWSVGRFGW